VSHPFHHGGEDETTHFLLEIAEASNAPLDLDRLLERIAGVVKKAIDYRVFAILLVTDRTQELRIRYEQGHPPEAKKLRIKVGRGITGRAAAERRAILVPDTTEFPDYISVCESTRSELAVPMILQGKVVGVIDIQSNERGYFTPRHVELASLIAARVAVVVENARLFRATARQAKTMETMIQISRELNGLLRLDELLPKIAELTRRLIGYDAFSIMRVAEDRNVLYQFFGMKFDQRVKDRGVIPIGHGICGIAAHRNESILVPDVTKDLRYINMNPATRSELTVPLVAKHKVIGVVDLESTRKGFFSGGHMQMMEMLAPQIAVALENADLYEKLAREEKRLERDLEAARELQVSLLPATFPTLPGLEFNARYQPAREIGGDLYDYVRHDGPDGSAGSLIIFTGDVSGKGAPAALYAAMVSGMLRNVAEERMSPGEMLVRLNDLLLDRKIESRFLTLLCAHLDLDTMIIEIANAGLPHPLFCRRGEIIPMKVGGVPLGMLPDMQYETEIVQLVPDDIVMFCSDGIFDNLNHNREEFGAARLREMVKRNWQDSARELVDFVFEHAIAWSIGRPVYDDMTVMALKALPKAQV
jgi:sigma-B regulation protein RsbU (phosphoserine phosphatase)